MEQPNLALSFGHLPIPYDGTTGELFGIENVDMRNPVVSLQFDRFVWAGYAK